MTKYEAVKVCQQVAALWPNSDWTAEIVALAVREMIKLDLTPGAATDELEAIRLATNYQTIAVGAILTPMRERANRWRALMHGQLANVEPPRVVKLRKALNFPTGPVAELACRWIGQQVVIDCQPVEPDRYPQAAREQRADAMGIALAQAYGLLEEASGPPSPETQVQWDIHIERFIRADGRLSRALDDVRQRNRELTVTPAGAAFLAKVRRARDEARGTPEGATQ